MIALGPLWFADWWGKRYAKVAAGLAAVVVLFYLGMLNRSGSVLETGREYLSFISLIGSLFVVSGGIHITVKGEATPLANIAFLYGRDCCQCAWQYSLGASMLLIRPWIRLNKYRVTAHHVVFFIFIVSNVGGSLTPVGATPLCSWVISWACHFGGLPAIVCPCGLPGSAFS